MSSRVRLKVHGRVQGVFYRQSTADQARMLKLAGWVANEKDGTVKIEAQGEKDRLESLINWCWKGPPSSSVIHIDIEWLNELEPEYTCFEILRLD
jgi:acylphosphatase